MIANVELKQIQESIYLIGIKLTTYFSRTIFWLRGRWSS